MRLLLSLTFFFAALAAGAMNEVFLDEKDITDMSKKITEAFSGYHKIDTKILAKMVIGVPEEKYSSNCGLLQCGAIKLWCGQSCSQDFLHINEYPLSLKINTYFSCMKDIHERDDLKNFAKKIKPDNDCNFSIEAAPLDLEDFLNRALHDTEMRAQYQGFDGLNDEELRNIVTESIADGLPIMAYYMPNPKDMQVRLYTIVGIRLNDLLLLDYQGEGLERLKEIEVGKFVSTMNTQRITDYIKMIDIQGASIKLRQKIIKSYGRVAAINIYINWYPYSIITFVNKKNYVKEESLKNESQENNGSNCLIL